MAKKILIHTQKALPDEDFVADIQIPLNAKKVNGLIVNAYDREKGVTVSWGYDMLQPSLTVAQFLADNKGLPEYLGRDVLVTGGSDMLAVEAQRDAFVNAIINAYITAALAKEEDAENQSVFTQAYYDAKLATLKQHVNTGFFGTGLRQRWFLMLGVNLKTTLGGQKIYGTAEPLKVVSQKKAWNPDDLKAWYRKFKTDMASNATASTPNYWETFFNEPSNFDPQTYEKAEIYVKVADREGGKATTTLLVNAYTYFGNKYGYPDATWFKYVPISSNEYAFDAYRTAEMVLGWYYDYATYVKSQAYWKNINWDKSNVGEMSVLFNSGRDIAIRDMPLDLNNNSKNIHFDLIALEQKEQVNSFVRLVFKNNGKANNPFYVKTYFFYET